MSINYNGASATDGLVFAYDLGNVRSYKGEPTVNLLERPGANGLATRGDIYNRATKTDLGNGKYRFVNDGTGGSTIRLYVNQADLIDGDTYACSISYEDFNPGTGSSIVLDWCDRGNTGFSINTYGPANRIAMASFRADNPHYFFDISIPSGASVTLFDAQVEHKDHATPYVKGERTATEGLLDIVKDNIIDLSGATFDSNAQMSFDGTDTYTETTYLSDIVGNSPIGISFELLVRPDDLSTYSGMMGDYVGPSGTGFAIKKVSLSDNRIEFRSYAVNSIPRSITYMEVGKYYHIVCTWSNIGTIQMFVNGELEITDPNTGTTWNHGLGLLRIGDCYNSMGVPAEFNGQIPVAKIYNRALTAEEVAQNFNSLKNRFDL